MVVSLAIYFGISEGAHNVPPSPGDNHWKNAYSLPTVLTVLKVDKLQQPL